MRKQQQIDPDEIKSDTFYKIIESIYFLDDSISVKNICFSTGFSFITFVSSVDYV
jgi:hypothetical protein